MKIDTVFHPIFFSELQSLEPLCVNSAKRWYERLYVSTSEIGSTSTIQWSILVNYNRVPVNYNGVPANYQ